MALSLSDIVNTPQDSGSGDNLYVWSGKVNSNNTALETNINAFNKRDVADGASAVAWEFDTDNTLATSGAKLASWKNNTTEKAYIDKDGGFWSASGNLNNIGVLYSFNANGISIAGGIDGVINLGRRSIYSDRTHIAANGVNIHKTKDWDVSWIADSSDTACPSYSVTARSAAASASTNITGGVISLIAGGGASSSAGAAHGGAISLTGGAGYGTGDGGNVVIDGGTANGSGAKGKIQTGSTVQSTIADGATAVAHTYDTNATYSTSGANLLRLSNNATPVFDFSYQGGIDHVNSGASTAAHSQSLNLNWGASSAQTSSGQYSCVIGLANTAAQTYSVAIGKTNNVTSFGGGAIGYENTVSVGYSWAFGYQNTVSTAGFAFGNRASPPFNTAFAFGSGNVNHLIVLGDLWAATTDATQTTLLSNSNYVTIPADTTWAFSALVVARSDETDGNLSAAWRLDGCITRDEANNTALVGSVTKTVIADGAAGAWDVTAEADDTNEALAIKVTGEAATNIRWVAKVDISQVTYA